jgi:hypothetical protein
MERCGRLTSGTTVAMPKSRDLKVAEEIIHVSVKFHHATVVVVSCLVRDNAVGLKKKSAKRYEESPKG